MARVGVIVPAAGQGARMGALMPKQYLELAGLPVLGHTLRVLTSSPAVNELVLVCPPGEEDYCRNMILAPLGIPKISAIVPGGKERQESVYNGLLALSAATELVVIHDGARPLLRREHLEAVLAAATEWGAATLAVPVKDTVKLAGANLLVDSTLPRERLWLTQTPQAFAYSLLIKAHRQAMQDGFLGTDDAALVEALGEPVRLVEGSYSNLKITTAEDLLIAEALLEVRGSRFEVRNTKLEHNLLP